MDVSRRRFLQIATTFAASTALASLTGCSNSGSSAGTTASTMGLLNISRLYDDAVPEGAALPFIDALVRQVDGSTIYGQILVPDGSYENSRPVVIMCHGFAGFTRFDDLCQSLCHAGAVVVVPHHRGAWGSQGEYLVSGCIEDAASLVSLVQSKDFSAKYRVNTEAVFLMGHSMGGSTVINAAGRVQAVRGVIMLAPCDVSRLYQDFTQEEMLEFLVDNGSEALHSQGTQAIYEDIAVNSSWMTFPVALDAASAKNYFIAAGDQDVVCPPVTMVDPLWEKLRANSGGLHVRCDYAAQHGLMGVRTRLAADVAGFMNDCLGA